MKPKIINWQIYFMIEALKILQISIYKFKMEHILQINNVFCPKSNF